MDIVEKTSAPPFALAEDALRRQLITHSNRTVLEAYLGCAHYSELQKLALQAEQVRNLASGPRVYLLPGIMGSRLGIPEHSASSTSNSEQVLWIDPEKIGKGRLTKLALPGGNRSRIPSLVALGAMVPIYLKLKLKLELAGFDVQFHAYDWRKSLEVLGQELLERVHRDPAKTVLLAAHSMGGLVSRVAITLEQQPIARSKIGRLVMIGTPSLGSFAPVLALRGVYPAVRKVAVLDPKNSPEKLAARVFNTFPGLLHMLPAREIFNTFDLFNSKNWPGSVSIAGLGKNRMGPRRSILKDVMRIRGLLAAPDERFFSIAGVNQETITGLERGGDSFNYLSTCEGDGTVPVSSATLPGMPAYYVEDIHPALPGNDAVTNAVIELLQNGTTTKLPQSWRPKHVTTRRIEEVKLRLQDTEKKTWAGMSMEERRALLLGLALPV